MPFTCVMTIAPLNSTTPNLHAPLNLWTETLHLFVDGNYTTKGLTRSDLKRYAFTCIRLHAKTRAPKIDHPWLPRVVFRVRDTLNQQTQWSNTGNRCVDTCIRKRWTTIAGVFGHHSLPFWYWTNHGGAWAAIGTRKASNAKFKTSCLTITSH